MYFVSDWSDVSGPAGMCLPFDRVKVTLARTPRLPSRNASEGFGRPSAGIELATPGLGALHCCGPRYPRAAGPAAWSDQRGWPLLQQMHLGASSA
jgi:hypothetical protein